MDILEKVPDLAEKGASQPKAKRTRYWQSRCHARRTAGEMQAVTLDVARLMGCHISPAGVVQPLRSVANSASV